MTHDPIVKPNSSAHAQLPEHGTASSRRVLGTPCGGAFYCGGRRPEKHCSLGGTFRNCPDPAVWHRAQVHSSCKGGLEPPPFSLSPSVLSTKGTADINNRCVLRNPEHPFRRPSHVDKDLELLVCLAFTFQDLLLPKRRPQNGEQCLLGLPKCSQGFVVTIPTSVSSKYGFDQTKLGHHPLRRHS